jgi:hypothetical protein
MIKAKLLLATVLALASMATWATTTTYTFGTLLSGSYSPSTSFATLSETTTDNVHYNFTLTLNGLSSAFSSGAFVGSMAVDSSTSTSLPSTSGVSGGVASVSASHGGAPGGSWDFRDTFGGGSDRLTGSETVSWTSTFSQPVNLQTFALHVQGLSSLQGGSAWYGAVAVVPEPETYALMTLGLGLAGGLLRRRSRAS